MCKHRSLHERDVCFFIGDILRHTGLAFGVPFFICIDFYILPLKKMRSKQILRGKLKMEKAMVLLITYREASDDG